MVINANAWMDQKSASSKPVPGSHMDLALRKKSSALSGCASSCFSITSSSRLPGTGAANNRPTARTKYNLHRKYLLDEGGSM
jgi:hypothetical protein